MLSNIYLQFICGLESNFCSSFFFLQYQEQWKNTMGNNVCSQGGAQISEAVPENQQHRPYESSDLVDFENTDASEIEDQPVSLSSFIQNHHICVSNGPRCQHDSLKLQAPKFQSVKLVKPQGGTETGGVLSKKKKKIPRCSIDLQNLGEFQNTLKEYVVTEKNMESFSKIEISQQKFIHLRREDVRKHYKIEYIVGEGAYGSVYRAKCLKTQEPRAIKIMNKDHLLQNKREQVFAQLELLKKMDHPNIIKLYQVFEWDNRYLVVTQFCDGGSIIDFIKSRSQFNEQVIKIILKQLLGCLNYLHACKIVHRDLKLQNIVFIKKVRDSATEHDIEIKLLDFGTACRLTKPKMRCNQLVGTVSYMPPEIIKGYFTEKCDLWSCGVILYILLSSKSPFKCQKKEDTLHKIVTHHLKLSDSSLWQEVSENAKDLLLKLLEKDPNQRISVEQALKHPWFQARKCRNRCRTSTFLQDLSRYYRQNNLISVLQSYLVFSKVSQYDRKQISDIFKELDHDQDGFINKNQLMQAYKEYFSGEYDQEDIEFILTKIDKDNSGSINLNEFIAAVVTKQKLWGKKALEEAFDYFDTDKTGYIEKGELAELLGGSESTEVEALLTELDLDNDQRVSKEEFISYLLRQGYVCQ